MLDNYADNRRQTASLRIQAASIIWWEYYSGREVVEGWPHLDGYLGGWTKDIRITPADLRSALVQCGYHAEAGQGTGAGQPQLD